MQIVLGIRDNCWSVNTLGLIRIWGCVRLKRPALGLLITSLMVVPELGRGGSCQAILWHVLWENSGLCQQLSAGLGQSTVWNHLTLHPRSIPSSLQVTQLGWLACGSDLEGVSVQWASNEHSRSQYSEISYSVALLHFGPRDASQD